MHGAVSRQIRALEGQLGVELFDRRRKPVRLTAQGERLRRRVREGFDSLCDAATRVKADHLECELSISCVPGLGASWRVRLLEESIPALHPYHLLTPAADRISGPIRELERRIVEGIRRFWAEEGGA